MNSLMRVLLQQVIVTKNLPMCKVYLALCMQERLLQIIIRSN